VRKYRVILKFECNFYKNSDVNINDICLTDIKHGPFKKVKGFTSAAMVTACGSGVIDCILEVHEPVKAFL
jgi:hypothetical protein